MREITGYVDAVSYKNRGIKIGGKWYNASSKLNLNELEVGKEYRFVLGDNEKTILEVIAETGNGKKVSKKVVKQAKMGNVDLITINQRLQKLEDQVARILATLERGNGYRTAFNVMLDEIEEIKRMQRNRDEWTVVVIKQLMAEVDEIKKKLNGGEKNE